MPSYRAYIVGPDGHFMNFHEFELPDDGAATQQTLALLDGHDIELWQQGRVIGLFKAKKSTGPNGSLSNEA